MESLGRLGLRALSQGSPRGNAELGAGLFEAEESVATVAANITTGAAANLALGHVAADVILRSIGVQGDVRRSSTMSSSRLLAWSRLSRRSRVTKPVRRVKMRSNRARGL
jgi:hypothetical protein